MKTTIGTIIHVSATTSVCGDRVHNGGIVDMSYRENEELVNGEWVEAKPLKYEPNLFERIVDKMPEFIQRWIYNRWG